MWWLRTTFLVLVAACCSVHAAPYEAHLAWDGYARSGGVTELLVVPNSTTSPTLDLRVFGATPPIRIALSNAHGGALPIAVPLHIKDASQPLRISEGPQFLVADEHTLALRMVPPERLLAAIAMGDPDPFLDTNFGNDDVTVINMNARGLPRVGLAYLALNGLAIDEAGVSQLLPIQVNALESYLARCGSLAAYHLSAPVLASLRQVAGCGGRGIHVVEDSGQLHAWINSLENARSLVPVPLEGKAEPPAATVEPAQSQLILAFFFIFALITAIFYRRLIGIIIVSGSATAMMLFNWGNESYSGSLLSVVQSASGASQGTLSGTMNVTGLYRGHVEIGFPANSALTNTTGDSTTELRTSDGRANVVVLASTALNSESRISFVVDVPTPNLPVLFFEGTRPSVHNSRSTALRNAVMLINGKAYAVPELAPAQQWIWSETTAIAQGPTWLSQRLATNEVGLAMPYDPDVLRPLNLKSGATGWSLVTAPRGI